MTQGSQNGHLPIAITNIEPAREPSSPEPSKSPPPQSPPPPAQSVARSAAARTPSASLPPPAPLKPSTGLFRGGLSAERAHCSAHSRRGYGRRVQRASLGRRR